MKQSLIIKLILFLEVIFIFVNADNFNVEFDGIYNSSLTINTTNETAKITVIFTKFPDYIKLSVYGNEDINYVISLYSDDKREERIQLAQSFYKNSHLYLTKNQIISNKIYVDVECSKTSCSYEFVVSAHEKISLEEGEQLYYYVTNETINMDFEIHLKSEKVNIWSRGGRAIENTLSNYIASSTDKNYFLVDGIKETANFKVIGSKGDIINAGSIGYNEELEDKPMMVDEETITVFLTREEFPRACFKYEMRNENETSQRNLIFVEGVVKNNIIKIIKNINGEKDDDELFTNGRFSEELTTDNIDQVELCFTFPEEENYKNIKEIIFTYQITLGKTQLKGQKFYEPQINGKMYLRNLLSNNINFFSGLEPEKSFNEMNYNIFSEIGYSNLYIYKCDNYPLCAYKKENIIGNPRNIDRFTTYSIYSKELKTGFNPISKNQILLMVHCVPESQLFDFYCRFDTLFYSDEDPIYTPENQYFSQYLLENEIDNFKISTNGEANIININIDIIIYVGDVQTLIQNSDENEYIQQHSSNKYFITIKLKKNSELLSDILFQVKALKNSFYTIVVNFVRNDIVSLITDKLQSGMNYLITIDPLKKENEENSNKIIKIYNDKYLDARPFLVNFYSLNCKLGIYKKAQNDLEKYSPIENFDYCYEDILTIDDDINFDGEYEYKIEVEEDDFSSYKEKLCMLYVSSVEINNIHKYNTRDIIIPDNTPQQIMFNNYLKHISYGYAHVNNEEDLIVKFNLIHKAKYIITFYYEFEEGKNYTVTSSNSIHLSYSEWKNQCPLKDEICYIIIDIYLEKTKDVEEPILELSVKSVDSHSVIYIPKNLLKMDYVQNEATQFYYTEVGENEIGYVVVNFYRFSGKVFSRLVSKNQNFVDEGANWAGKYKFPTSEEESLKYDSFTKKINFNTADENCDYGCYLLISIQSNVDSSSDDSFRNYPYSIIVQSALEDMSMEKIPPIKIKTDEYIIGDLQKSNGNQINEQYSLWINDDADKIVIDFLSKSAGLYINIEDKLTSTNKAHFKFSPSGKDSIYTITKEEINQINKKESNDSIKGLLLNIGIWTEKIDSINTTIYSFTVHLELNKKEEIHRVSSDRKNLCQPTKIDNSDKYSYRCLFVIENYFSGELNNLLLYSILEDNSAGYQIYSEYIDPSDFEFGNQSFIENRIPTKDSEFSTDKTKLNYLYIEKGLSNEKYLLVSVVSTKDTRIELLSTFYNYIDLITPNPSTLQLFLVKKDKSLTLNFPTDHLLITYLNSITGSAEVYWEEDADNKNYLYQQDYGISLNSLKGKNGKLVIKSTSSYTDYDIGFAFYLTYTVKYEKNFDELILGRSVNFVYSENDFPLVLYTRLEDNDKDLQAFFTFYEMIDNNNEKIYNENSIKGSAILVKEKTIYDIKSNTETVVDLSKSLKFNYDPAFRTGFIKIKKEDLKNFNINSSDNPNLYIKLEKLNNNQNFKRLNLDITVSQENTNIPISEKKYQYGVLLENEEKKEYLLKTSLKRVFIILEASSINDDLSFKMETLSGESLNKNDEKNKNGKKILSFSVDPNKDETVKLIISKDKSSGDKVYFTFKYINVVDMKYFREYEISNNSITIEYNKVNTTNNYKISLEPINDYNNYKINYFVKLFDKNYKNVPKKTISLGEEEEKLLVKEFNNPSPVNGQLVLEFKNVEINPRFAQVIAQVYDNGINEFLSYEIYEFPKEEEKKSDDITPSDNNSDDNEDDDDNDKKYIIAIVVISVVLVVIIVGLIIALTFFKKANKNLLNEVNKISFSDQEGLVREQREE